MTPDPVCGVDGVTYANRCVAVCQGIAIAAPAACESAGGATAAARLPSTSAFAKTIATTATIGRAVLNKHRAQGFTFVARVVLDTHAKPVEPTVVQMPAGNAAAEKCAVGGWHAARRLSAAIQVLSPQSAWCQMLAVSTW